MTASSLLRVRSVRFRFGLHFLDLGSRDAVDKALQRLVHAGQLRRIDRGLYDINSDEADKPKNRGGRTLMSAAFQQVISVAGDARLDLMYQRSPPWGVAALNLRSE